MFWRLICFVCGALLLLLSSVLLELAISPDAGVTVVTGRGVNSGVGRADSLLLVVSILFSSCQDSDDEQGELAVSLRGGGSQVALEGSSAVSPADGGSNAIGLPALITSIGFMALAAINKDT